MSDRATVADLAGVRAEVEHPPRPGEPVAVQLPTGERLLVPAGLLREGPEGSQRFPFRFADLTRTAGEGGGADVVVIPVLEETLRVGTRARETGRVRLRKTVETHEETVDVPLRRETVEVERVPVNRVVEAPEPPRQEGDRTVIPIYEETLVVEKRLVLREELHVVRHREERTETRAVTLRREAVAVDRLPAADDTPSAV